MAKGCRTKATGVVSSARSEQWARSIERWQGKLAPRLPDIPPEDLALILGSILQPKGVPRRWLLRKAGDRDGFVI